MKKRLKQQPSRLITLLVVGMISSSKLLNAQIVPDQTLPNNSTITLDQGVINIRGGTQVGTNLFHSFETFSFSKEIITHFNNSLAIDNIFSRVTGSSPSNINGLIQVNGFANLFLINPNGIIFGPNAALNMRGSFLATTASDIMFSDGAVFGTKNPSSLGVLTVSQPIGLTFSNPQPIQINNQGHNLPPSGFPNLNFPSGLQTFNQTLSIIGGEVILDGGILSAINGSINIGAVESGVVSLNYSNKQLTLDYNQTNHFQNIFLKNRSLINIFGLSPEFIDINAKNLQITDGSFVNILNAGSKVNPLLNVEATESIFIQGKSQELDRSSSIQASTIGTGGSGEVTIITPLLSVTNEGAITTTTFSRGQGNNISVETQQLFVEGGGGISSAALGKGNGGNVEIVASESVIVRGFAPGVILSSFLPGLSNFPSSLGSFTGGTGAAGNLQIISKNLKILDGGNVGTATFGQGAGGQVFIDVQDSIEVKGVSALFLPSIINSATYGDGQAGQIILNSDHLKILDGGNIVSSAFDSGDAGTIEINALDSVEIRGFTEMTNSSILSSVEQLDPVTSNLLGLDLNARGQSGNITINTENFTMTNQGFLSVQNDGLNNGGSINLNAQNIQLEKGQILATTQSGQGGNINLRSSDIRLFESNISTTAGGTGDGGNININTNFLFLFDNSSITANAFEGNGGNINITAQGLFASPDSAITATSQFGVDGQVTLDTNFFEANQADTGLPDTNLSIDQRVAQFCEEAQNKSRFTIEGRQGFMYNPENRSSAYDLYDLAPLGEVIGVEKLPDGRVRLLSCNRLNSERQSPEN